MAEISSTEPSAKISMPQVCYGHSQAWAEVASLVATKRLPHALLLQGPQGIGKLTFSLCLAQALRVQDSEQSTTPADFWYSRPVRLPGSCRPLHNRMCAGSDPDFLLITSNEAYQRDTESHRVRKEDVDQLIRFFTTKSAIGNRRIAILDDANDIPDRSANALLKLLEEPTDNALIIVIAHGNRSLLPTLHSRCYTMTLRPLSPQDTDAVVQTLMASAPAGPQVSQGATDSTVFLEGRPGLWVTLEQLGLARGLEPWIAVIDHAITLGALSPTAPQLVAEVFQSSRYDHDIVTLAQLTDLLSHLVVLRLRTVVDFGNYGRAQAIIQRVVPQWFRMLKQKRDAENFHLDAKATALQMLSALAAPAKATADLGYS